MYTHALSLSVAHAQLRGRVPACDAAHPYYIGSFQLRIQYGNGGYMQSAKFRFDDPAIGWDKNGNFVFNGPFYGMQNYIDYTAKNSCGDYTVTIWDDKCSSTKY